MNVLKTSRNYCPAVVWGKEIRDLKFEINLKSQISNLEFQISNLKSKRIPNPHVVNNRLAVYAEVFEELQVVEHEAISRRTARIIRLDTSIQSENQEREIEAKS